MKPASGFLALVMGALISGCAMYGDWAGRMEGEIARQNPQGALEVLDNRSGLQGKDAALYQLNRAMLLRMKGDYAASNASFEAAKTIIDRLLAVSVTEQAEALAINDAQRAYIGAPFERAYLHVYEALNYLDLGSPDQARVEILQLDVLLGGFERDKQYGAALPRYLSGMVFEALGETSDAMIAYRQAYEAYHRYPARFGVAIPPSLGRDLVRLGERLGLDDEVERYRKEFGLGSETPGPRADQAEVIVLLNAGLAPIKQESNVVAPTTTGRFVAVSMPYYLVRRPAVTGASVTVDGATAHTVLAEDIDAVAEATLDQERPAILARAVARAVIKNDVSRRVSKDNELLGAFVNIAGVVTERADTRSWSTLPSRIYVARLPVEPGRRLVHVQFSGRAEPAFETTVNLRAGEKRFISLYKVTPQDLPALAVGRRRQ